MQITTGIAGALLLAVPLAVLAQQPSSEGFTESIDVRVVNLEAVVTDRAGQPVRGLTAADFRLLVDGREVPIDYFSEVVDGAAVPVPPESSPGAPLPAPPPAAPATGRIGRGYLLFLDDSFSIAAQRNVVLKRIEKSLELLGSEDRMALVAFDGSRLDKLSDWTNDRAALAAAFERARKRPARGHRVLAERRGVVNDVELMTRALESQGWDEDIQRGAPGLLAGGGERVTGPKHYSSLLRAVDAAAAALRGFPPPPAGRKVLLLLSGGWPEPGLLSPLIRDANRLGYTVYPVDVPGIDLMSVADLSTEWLGRRDATSEWETRSEVTLEALALATGGRAALNSARLSAFQRAAEDTASYYWLGFSPAWQADDRHHAIRLEVRRPGLTVRSRHGYSDLSPRSEAALEAESFLLFGPSGKGGRELQVEVGAPRRAGSMIMEVPVVFSVPALAFDLSPSGEGWLAEGQLLLGALDVWGARSDLPSIPLRLRFRDMPRPEQLVRYKTTLRLRRVKQKLVLRVSAPRSGALLWKELELGPRGAH